MTNLFDTSSVKKGLLITVKFENGKKRSGIVTDVTANEIKYRYYDEVVEMIQSTVITRDQVEDGAAAFVTSAHIGKEKTEAKTAKADATSSFFKKLEEFSNTEKLMRVFRNEDPKTLALIASFLQPQRRMEFLYRLPDEIFTQVNRLLDSVSNIDPDVLKKVEAQLEEKFNHFKDTASRKAQDAPTDPFGGLFETFFGGIGSKGPEELFKNFNPNDIKNIFGEAMNQDKQPPLPNADQMREMMENLPKMMNDLFGGLNNRDNDDDDNDRRNGRK